MSTDVVFSGRKGAPYVEGDTPDPVTEYGRSKEDFFRRFLELKNGIPSHDTFERVFARLEPGAAIVGGAGEHAPLAEHVVQRLPSPDSLLQGERRVQALVALSLENMDKVALIEKLNAIGKL